MVSDFLHLQSEQEVGVRQLVVLVLELFDESVQDHPGLPFVASHIWVYVLPVQA